MVSFYFGDLNSIFKVTQCLRIMGNSLSAFSPEGLNGFWNMDKNRFDFGDLNSIFKVTQGFRMLENSLFAPYLLKEWMVFD